jgi:hypothetical protein
MKLKGRRFETVSEIQRESQAVLDSIKGNDFHGAFEARKKRWDTFPRRLFGRRWQPKFSKLSQHFFFNLVRELSDRTSYYCEAPAQNQSPHSNTSSHSPDTGNIKRRMSIINTPSHNKFKKRNSKLQKSTSDSASRYQKNGPCFTV